MKRIILLSIMALLTHSGRTQPAIKDLKNFHWLLGEWKRTNIKEGKSEIEKWTEISATEFSGLSIHLKGKDTAFVEKIRLISKDGSVFYVADIPENKQPVFFRLTSEGDQSFVCENAAHDFPKMISYKRSGQGLKATISGNRRSIDYIFERL